MTFVDEKAVREDYHRLTKLLIERNLTITTMESITSGQIASLITDTEGASAVLKGAFVTYSNDAKVKQGVSADTIRVYGVYSAETAREMAVAAKEAYGADISIGVTGSTGNIDPNNADSVPGQVYYAIVINNQIRGGWMNIGQMPDRLSYKLYIADQIARNLFDLLNENTF